MSTVSTHIRNTFNSIGEINSNNEQEDLLLKMYFTKNFLRYFIFNTSKSECVYLGDYTIHHANSDAELIDQLKNILEKDALFKRKFKEVIIGADGAFELIPASFFLQTEKRADLLLNDTVYLSYSFSNDLELIFKNYFHSYKINHIGSSLIEAIKLSHNTLIDRLYVNVNKETLDITSFSGDGKFRFFNTYAYKNATDFIYFVLLVADELSINRENCELLLSGEVDINSKIYEWCFRYFRTISFLKPAAQIHFSKAFEHFPKHLNYNIYNLGI